MSESSSGGGGNNGLYFIVGGLLVVVVGAFLVFGGYFGEPKAPSGKSTTTIERTITPGSDTTTKSTTTQ